MQTSITKSAYMTLQADNILYLGACYNTARVKNVIATPTSAVQLYETCPREAIPLLDDSETRLSAYLTKIVGLVLSSKPSNTSTYQTFNAFMLNEYLSEMKTEAQRDTLWRELAQFFDIHVLMWYRRLYEWLPSYFYQKIRYRYVYTAVWPGQVHPEQPQMMGRDRFVFDLYNLTQRSELFHEDLWLYSELMDALEEEGTTPMEFYYQQWAKYTNRITVLSMHQPHVSTEQRTGQIEHRRQNADTDRNSSRLPDPLLANFFCSGVAIPETVNHTCHAALNDPHFAFGSRNRMDNGQTDMIATAAHRSGLLHTDESGFPIRSRYHVRRQIDLTDRYLKRLRTQSGQLNNSELYRGYPLDKWKLLSEFPVECLPERTLDRLYKYSWQAEKHFFPGSSDEVHRGGFDSYRSSGRYCWINTQAVLSDLPWSSFLREL
jgi:hypothetical protein